MPTNTIKSNIILVGFMGAGKTTLGKDLAKELNYKFIDSDVEIEKQEGATINEIFESKGEEYFRDLESNFIENFRLTNCVLATGGGMPVFKDNMTLLKELGTVIYINTPFGLIFDRLKLNNEERPLLKMKFGDSQKKELLELFNLRKSTYEKADLEIDGSDKVKNIVKLLNN